MTAATQHDRDARPGTVEELLAYVPVAGLPTGQPQQAPVKVELSYTQDSQNSDGSIHWYEMKVHLTNISKRPIDAWHVDLSLPRVLLKPNTTYSRLVEEQSDAEVAVLRATEQSHGGTLYPRDRREVFSVRYRMDKELFRQAGDLFARPIVATAFADGEEVEVRKTVHDMQRF